MRKLLFFVLLLLSLLTLFKNSVLAADEFATNVDTVYEVKETGETTVTTKVRLTNVFSNIYATSYSLVLDSINPTDVKAYSASGKALETSVSKENTKTFIKVKFSEPVVGKDNYNDFNLSYNESSFAVRTGEVWEVSIPRLSEPEKFSSYNLKLIVPEKIGLEAYISPNPRKKSSQNGVNVYEFTKEDISKTGIVAGFGEFQVFSFNLNYHLENPLAKSATTEITFPPDTAYQKIYYQDITPKPSKMSVDSDGNWIGEFSLGPRERIDVNAKGFVQIFSNYRPFAKPTTTSLSENLKPTKYWNTDNEQIRKIASSLNTPKDIYDYVSTHLKYDYTRVKPNLERYGAVKALDNPDSAICMEFTDLFIALARSKGIPAREINGYAYTENPQIQPLSLVNDVLHSWPEYYDTQKQVWIPVDPTWGSTTGGVDFFNKLDLRHFTFVIHGKDDSYPYPAGSYKLGSNPQKDVFVSFGSLPNDKQAKLTINANLSGWIPLISNRLNVEITNPGPTAVYDIKPVVYFDSLKKDTDTKIDVLLPFSSYKSYVEVPFSFLGTKTPSLVKVLVLDNQVEIPTKKDEVVIYNILFIFIVSLIIVLTILFKSKKLSFDKIAKLWKFQKKGS